MLKFIAGVLNGSSEKHQEEPDYSYGANGTSGDAGVDPEDLLAKTHNRPVPVLEVEDNIENTLFDKEFRLTVELGQGYFGFTSKLDGSTTQASAKSTLRESSKTSIKGKAAILDLQNKNVVCKIYVSQDDDYNINYVAKEIEVLKYVYSPYVTNLYAHYQSPSGHRLIVDYFSGRLSEIIEHRGYCEGYVASITKQLLLGVVHLHSLGIVHRSISPDCVLVNVVSPNKVAHVKLSGFGHAAVLPSGETLELFGHSKFSVKAGFSSIKSTLEGFSSRSNMSHKSGRSMKSAEVVVGGPRYMKMSTMDAIIEQPSSPKAPAGNQEASSIANTNEEVPLLPSDSVVQGSATVVLHGESIDRKLDSYPKERMFSHADVVTSGIELPSVQPGEGEDTENNTVNNSNNAAPPHLVKQDTFDQPVRLITRPSAPSSSAKYRYATSVEYDTVPFKSYNKLTGGLPIDAFSDFSYLAPEMLLGHYGPQVDAWSIGCVAYQMLSGHLPFSSTDGADSADMVSLIVSGVYSDKGKVYRSLSELSRSFVAALLTVDATARHSPEEALQHMWITDTTQAAAAAHKNGYSEQSTSKYTYIISPHRVSLKSLLGKSRTLSNISQADHPQQSRDADDTTTTSPDSNLGPVYSRRYSGLSDPGNGRLDPVPMEPFYGDDNIVEEDERADLLFEAF